MTNESRRYKIECVPVGNPIEKTQIKNTEDAYKYIMRLYGSDIELIESFIGIYIDNNNNVIGWSKIASGGIDKTIVDQRVLFKYAIELLAPRIIICHNHPSGKVLPSRDDDELTNRIVDGCKILGLQLIDHLVVTKETYYSYLETNKL